MGREVPTTRLRHAFKPDRGRDQLPAGPACCGAEYPKVVCTVENSESPSQFRTNGTRPMTVRTPARIHRTSFRFVYDTVMASLRRRYQTAIQMQHLEGRL